MSAASSLRTGRRVLVTGMSGTGKSTALGELGRRGFRVVDMDSSGWSEWVPLPDDPVGEWLWREDRVAELLASEDGRTLYVSGCSSNQGRFYDRFDAIVLLSAPVEVILGRVASRTTNDYGRGPRERDRIVSDLESAEPLLRATCTHEIDASAPLEDVVDALIAVGREVGSPTQQTRRMQALVSELWRLEGPRVDHHVGDLAWQRFQHVGHEGEWRIRIWEEGDEPVAWAWVRSQATLQHEIRPVYRGGALHEELLDWYETVVEGEDLRASALSTDATRLEVLRGRGYEVNPQGRTFVYHACELSDAPQPTVPDGYRLRTVEPEDLARRVEIHRIVWAPSRVTKESFANVQAAWPYRADLDCVVEAPDGSFAAYCLAWLDPDNRVGELEPVGTHPDHRRRGLASAVCRFAHRRLREEGAERAIVYSATDSDATALYESVGMREHARSLELVRRR